MVAEPGFRLLVRCQKVDRLKRQDSTTALMHVGVVFNRKRDESIESHEFNPFIGHARLPNRFASKAAS